MGTWSVRTLSLALALAAALAAWPRHAEAGSSIEAPPGTRSHEIPVLNPDAFGRLGTREGLIQAHITALAQDAAGFLWIGSEENLTRYDGARVVIYAHDTEDATSLSGVSISALAVDKAGRLWVGTGDGGLDRFDPVANNFVRLKDPAGGEPLAGISVLQLDEAGLLWVGLDDGSLASVDPVSSKITRHTLASGENETLSRITALAAGKGGALYVGTAEDGLFVFDRAKGKVAKSFGHTGDAKSLASDKVAALLVDAGGTLWVGTDEGLDRLNGEGFEHRRSVTGDPATLVSDKVTALFEDRSKVLWVGTRGGLSRLDVERKRFASWYADLNNPAALSYPWVTTMTQDRTGILWIGTYAGYITKYDEFRTRFAHPLGRIIAGTAFHEDREGTLWIGSHHPGSFTQWKKGATTATVHHILGTPEQEQLDLGETWVTDIHEDKKGRMWLGTDNQGLIRYDRATGGYEKFAPTEDGDPEVGPLGTWIWRMAEDQDGVLWLAMFPGGLCRFDPDARTFKTFLHDEKDPTSISSDGIYALRFDVKDPTILWLGTAQGGLNRFDTKTGKAVVYRHGDEAGSLSHNDVTALEQTADGTLWVGTYGGGLNRLAPGAKTFKRYTTADGMGSNSVFATIAGSDGSLWLSTSGGITRFDIAHESFSQFDSYDGALSEFAQNASYIGPDGTIYFGGMIGFTALKPETIAPAKLPSTLRFTSFKINHRDARFDRPLSDAPKIDLGYRDNLLEFEFAPLAFGAPEKTRYQVKLSGFDDDWVESTRPYVSYSNLRGGNYTLNVRATDRFGRFEQDGISLAFHVSPPPWLQWWAFVLYGVVLLTSFLAYSRWQRTKVLRLQKDNRLAEVERDLELTSVVQAGFLPEAYQVAEGPMRLVGFYRAANVCSGDWWWHEAGPGQNMVLMGDVTGHGAGPAMVTAAAATAFRVQSGSDMLRRLQAINGEVMRVARGKYWMTMTALVLDPDNSSFEIFNAGGLPVFVHPRGSDKAKSVMAPGTPLGNQDLKIGRQTGALTAGDRVLICTDGIPELNMADGRQFGLKRLRALFESTRDLSLDEAAKKLVQESDLKRGNNPQDDDWTFALIEWAGRPAARP